MLRRALGIILLAGVCHATTLTLNKFNAGEVSPLLKWRSDFAKYDNSCLQLQNMLVTPQGPVVRRPGTKYVADANLSTARLIPFEYSKTDAYILEFGNDYMRVYRNGAQVQSGGSPYAITTSFEDEDLDSIQYVQSADVMYLVDANDPPQVLSRTGHTSWTIADVNFDGSGPFQDENITTTTLTASGTTGSITVTASSSIFVSTDVGETMQIRYPKAATALNGVLSADGASSTLAVEGAYHFTTHGTWTGQVTLQRSYDSGSTWSAALPPAYSQSDYNVDETGTESDADVIYRVLMETYSSGSCTYNLALQNYYQTGSVEITGYTSGTQVTATVLHELGGTSAVKTWSRGAWSDTLGWPRTVAFFKGRLYYGGSASFQQTLWASQDDGFEDMSVGTLDDGALVYALPGQNPIQWLLPSEELFVGTLGGVGKFSNSDNSAGPTPTDVQYIHQQSHGAEYIQAVAAGNAALYVERGGGRVREFAYSLEQDKYIAPDMTLLAEHITDTGVTAIAYASRPIPTLWCVREDGDALAFVYSRENDVLAWSHIVTDGTFQSVAVIPGSDEDEVWFLVDRTINGTAETYVEQLQPLDWGTDANDCYFVDCGKTYDGGDSVTITGVTRADPAVVTVSSLPVDIDGTALVNGGQVRISMPTGMSSLDGNVYTVAGISGSTFQLKNSAGTATIDSTGYAPFSTDGSCMMVEDTFSTLANLEAESAQVYADGVQLSNVTPSSGSVTIDDFANVAAIGLPFVSTVETMPIVYNTQNGSSLAESVRFAEVRAYFIDTLGCEVGTSDSAELVDFGQDTLYTGWRTIPNLQGYWNVPTIVVTQESAYPMTLSALVIK